MSRLAVPVVPATIVTRLDGHRDGGREDELSSRQAFVDLEARTGASLVLEGVAGIGKSTLWGAGETP
jgi:MoxR-like ATPase